MIDSDWFVNTQANGYWTSTAYADSSVDSAWTVDFYTGGVDITYRNFDGGRYVRLIR